MSRGCPSTALPGSLEVDRSTLIYHVGRRGLDADGAWQHGADGKNAICPGIGLCPVRGSAHRRLHDALLDAHPREPRSATMRPTAADRERDVRSLGAMVRTLEKLTAHGSRDRRRRDGRLARRGAHGARDGR